MDRPYATRPRPKPLYTIADGHYLLDLDPAPVQFEVSRVRRDRFEELRCTLAVKSGIAGALELDEEGTIWHEDGVSLTNPVRRKQLALDLARRARTKPDDFDWHAHLDRLAFEVSKAESKGLPVGYLGDIAPATSDDLWTVDGFPLLVNHPMILFGDGGTLKSYFALYVAGELAKRGIVTLLADWELDGPDHRVRANKIWGADIPPIVYMRCTRPLVDEIDRIARAKHLYNAQYVIVDSIGFACHTKVEDSETPLRYFPTIRSLGIGSLHIAHTTKTGDQTEHKPFGSTFWHNGARSTWFAKAEEETPETTARTVALMQRKNMGKFNPAMAYRFSFEPNLLRINRADPTSIADLAVSLPASQRIKAAITNGPLSFADIAEATGMKEDTVRKTVSRRTGLFLVREGANGAKTVALLERRFGG